MEGLNLAEGFAQLAANAFPGGEFGDPQTVASVARAALAEERAGGCWEKTRKGHHIVVISKLGKVIFLGKTLKESSRSTVFEAICVHEDAMQPVFASLSKPGTRLEDYTQSPHLLSPLHLAPLGKGNVAIHRLVGTYENLRTRLERWETEKTSSRAASRRLLTAVRGALLGLHALHSSGMSHGKLTLDLIILGKRESHVWVANWELGEPGDQRAFKHDLESLGAALRQHSQTITRLFSNIV